MKRKRSGSGQQLRPRQVEAKKASAARRAAAAGARHRAERREAEKVVFAHRHLPPRREYGLAVRLGSVPVHARRLGAAGLRGPRQSGRAVALGQPPRLEVLR
jgi:hypothetical protein